MQYCLDPLDLRLRALDSSVGLVTLGNRTLYARLRTFVITAALIEGLLLRGTAAGGAIQSR